MTEVQNTTRQRYFNAITEMYKSRNNIKAAAIVAEFSLSSQTLAIMIELLIIERLERGVYRWIGSAPTYDMAIRILTNISKSLKKYQNPQRIEKTDTPKTETQSGEPRKIDEQYCIDFLKKTGKYEIFLIERRQM